VIELIEAKQAALEAATIRLFEGTGIRIVKGRFGPYITDGRRKAPIPRTRDPASLSVFECEAFLAEAEAAKAGKKKGGAKKAAAKKTAEAGAAAAPKKAAAKKAAAKKAPAKRAAKKG
jgi:DNA topoisomerase I